MVAAVSPKRKRGWRAQRGRRLVSGARQNTCSDRYLPMDRWDSLQNGMGTASRRLAHMGGYRQNGQGARDGAGPALLKTRAGDLCHPYK
jgi:hypothetical protein